MADGPLIEIIPPEKTRRRAPSKNGSALKKRPPSRLIELPALIPEFLEELRHRLRSGMEKPGGTRPVYKAGGIKIRTSSRSISLVAQVVETARQKGTGSRYITLKKIGVNDTRPITRQEIEAVYANLERARNDARTLERGEIEDRAAAENYASLTFKELVEHARLLPSLKELKTYDELFAMLDRHFLPYCFDGRLTFADVRPAYISKVEAKAWLQHVFNTRGHATACKVQGNLRTMIKHMRKADIDISFPQLDSLEPVEERKNYLKRPQIKSLWNACEVLNDHERDLVRFMLLSAQRETQIAELRWSWIDFEEKVIHFPKSVMKGKKPVDYDMPITGPMLDILKRRYENRVFERVFASRTGKAVCNFSNVAARLDCEMAGIDHRVKNRYGQTVPRTDRKAAPFEWQFHDFRRTALFLLENADDPFAEEITPAHLKTVIAHKSIKASEALGHYTNARMLKLKRRLFTILSTEYLRTVDPQSPHLRNEAAKLDEEIRRLTEIKRKLSA